MNIGDDPRLVSFLYIGIIVLLFVLAALMSAAGKALDLANRNTIRKLSEDGVSNAIKLEKLLERPSKHIAAIQHFVCCAALIISLFIIVLFSGMMQEMWKLVIVSILLCCVFVGFTVILPKKIAIQHSDELALSLAGFLTVMSVICTPFVAISMALANMILVITRQKTDVRDEVFSEEDVMSMLEAGQDNGDIKEEGKKMINSIFEFDDKLAHEIMTPRTDVFAVDINAPLESYLDDLMDMHYSRIPVYEEDIDNIIGILNIKDYMTEARVHGFEKVDIKSILREAFFVPDTKNIDSLFYELQKRRQHIAILIDEYGGFSGIVTMEDIIEEVMGDIDDEYDDPDEDIKKIAENTYIIDGGVNIDDLNEEIESEFESEDSETIGGLLIDIIGEIPDDNEHYNREITVSNYKFTILSIKDKRIEKIKMEKLTQDDENSVPHTGLQS